MGKRRGAAIGAGALGTMTAVAALVQQSLLLLLLCVGGVVVYGIWFWLRVFRCSSAASALQQQQQQQQRPLHSSSRSKSKRLPKSDDVSPGGAAAGAAPAAAAAAAASTTAADEDECPAAAAEAPRRRPRSSRSGSSSKSFSTADSEGSEGSRDSGSSSSSSRSAEGYRWLEGDAECAYDSADEADSEAEQDSLLPAAAQRQRLPRRMSFSSFNLAAGCFPAETKVQHHIVSACMYTPTLPDTQSLLRLLDRLAGFHRFSSVPILNALYPRWQQVSVQPAAHLRRLLLRDSKELHLCIEWVMSQPCDSSRPRWQLWLLRNAAAQQQQQQQEGEEVWDSRQHRTEEERRGVDQRDGLKELPRHCIVLRADHCIGDGVSLIEVGLRLLTDSQGIPLNEWPDPPVLKGPATAADEHLCLLPTPTAHLLRWTKLLLRAPRRLASAVWGCVLLLLGSFRAFAAALLIARDACTPLTGTAAERDKLQWARQQRIASAAPLSLEFVREIKKAARATLNDIFVAAFTGAVRRYCELQGDFQFSQAPAANLPRVLLACAFYRRTRELPDWSQLLLRNRFALTSLALPADSRDPRERLGRVRKATLRLKRCRQAAADFLTQRVVGHLMPRQFICKAAEGLFSRHSVVFSNLPAYTAPVYFCGCEITEVQVVYPNLIPQVEVVSYAGRVFFSIVFDPSIVKEGHKIPNLFVEELYRLADAFGIARPTQQQQQQQQESCAS
ncbi:COG3639: ABC-type phosphate/phosphonate transport system, permease component (ISS), related [Eimeria tenella]|uniref:COG3639: ABC-type phosphate/phosphonate transport system, permease component (ISS), related n=1 Tax=Eimeria tenella TaxID=5802 RepID=U6KM60_EIMTE|nr:COG3639: ABC-type phosphate/phosphonate transport system, permease component (ISS), related [Eimeria tenella]CDJ37886.1 COG3639: ABC-type phosphate/phosphonate transport system, permease component (ISS), related [Eimeria tenella]|eukprot:XP_013228724.1 COG3639: ABC-type phosphate/phosphonate transport system, permease component (ISS), related [Eimeria tenella]